MTDHDVAEQPGLSLFCDDEAQWPILICLLGNFLLLKAGQPVALRNGGKTKAPLSYLGLQYCHHIPRDTLLQMLWPSSDAALSSQSLHSLVYSLHKLVGDSIGGAAPVCHDEGGYRLNVAAGIGVDVARFDALVERERLRARYLTLLAYLADHHYNACEYITSLDYA